MVNLEKGGTFCLTKTPNLKTVMAGLGWEENNSTGCEFDLDLVIFQVNIFGRCPSEDHFIFYNHLSDALGAVVHSGDNRTGTDDGGDAEMASITFSNISPSVEKIVIAVTIYEAKRRGQNFGMVNNAYIRIVNVETGEEILRYDLAEDYGTAISIVFGELIRTGDNWQFKAVGEGSQKELAELCREHGLNV